MSAIVIRNDYSTCDYTTVKITASCQAHTYIQDFSHTTFKIYNNSYMLSPGVILVSSVTFSPEVNFYTHS